MLDLVPVANLSPYSFLFARSKLRSINSDWFSFWMGHSVASVASTLRKTGTVVLLAKRPTAESENRYVELDASRRFFFCTRTMVAIRSPPETSISNDAITTNS